MLVGQCPGRPEAGKCHKRGLGKLLGLGLQYSANDPFPKIARDNDREPPDDGQYGMALRYLSPALNDAEFGFYFVNAHSRLPLVTGQVPNMGRTSGQSAGVAQAVGGALSVGKVFPPSMRCKAWHAAAILNGLPQESSVQIRITARSRKQLGKYSHHRNSRQLPLSCRP